MNPILQAIYDDALMPVQNDDFLSRGLDRARIPLQQFMLGQTREKDMMLFMEMSETKPVDDVADVPLTVWFPPLLPQNSKPLSPWILDLHSIHCSLIWWSPAYMSMGMMMLSP